MARHTWSRLGPEAQAVVLMVQEMGRKALLEKQARRRRRVQRKVPLLSGRPASVAWCTEHLSSLRGYGETTVLPVGCDIEALRYGLECLSRVRAQGAIVDWPIAFVMQRARRAHKEH